MPDNWITEMIPDEVLILEARTKTTSEMMKDKRYDWMGIPALLLTSYVQEGFSVEEVCEKAWNELAGQIRGKLFHAEMQSYVEKDPQISFAKIEDKSRLPYNARWGEKKDGLRELILVLGFDTPERDEVSGGWWELKATCNKQEVEPIDWISRFLPEKVVV